MSAPLMAKGEELERWGRMSMAVTRDHLNRISALEKANETLMAVLEEIRADARKLVEAVNND
jgi:hypothetical protein